MPVIYYVSGVRIDDALGLNELTTLSCLSSGLSALRQQVSLAEAPIIKHEEENQKRVFFFGFGLLSQEQEELVPCYFHWFGTSVCNYARLVGFLSGLAQGVFTREQAADPAFHAKVRTHCSNYVDSIPELAPIKVWRNKVFAHFAATDPRPGDNAALLDTSVMSPITFMNGRLRVGGLIQGSSGAEADLPNWSVTESYEALSRRYWPPEAADA